MRRTSVTMQLNKALVLFALSAINMCCVGAEGVGPAPAQTQQILVLDMRVTNGRHEVTSARILDSRTPLKMRVSQAAGIAYAVTDAADNPLAIATMEDPQIVRGPMAPPGEASQGHAAAVRDSVEYVLRVPYSKDMRYLKFLLTAPPNGAAREKIANDKARQVIDLQPFVTR